jgi:two-component system nitrogen regulation response regulator NtrX
MQLLEEIKTISPDTSVLMVTAFGDMETAVKAMQKGAYDFVAKPFSADQIEVKVNKAVERLDLVLDNKNLREELMACFELIGNSKIMMDLKDKILKVAQTDGRVLITGDHGTGKELIARAIQKSSRRAHKSFVKVNCAAIPESLIEAELFGSEKGSYTSSTSTKTGKFQQADGGTLFLDEIGDMCLAAQSKILRVLESGEVQPVGSDKTSEVNVRIIAATNQDLEDLINKKKFREDLLYRLNVVPIESPSLSQRRDDIPILIEHFIRQMGRASSLDQVFLPEAVEYMKSLNWPGNVRELKNAVERAVILGGNGPISRGKIEEMVGSNPQSAMASISGENKEVDTSKPFKKACEEFEKSFIIKMLQENSGNVSETARSLGLQRSYLHTKMKSLGIK